MNLDTWLNQNAIFEAIIAKAQGKTYLQYMSAEEFTYYCRLNWGERTMFCKMENADIDSLATQIDSTLSDKWDKLFDFSQLDFNLGASITHKTVEQYSGTTDRDNTGQQDNKVSAFNTDALITDTGVSNIGSESVREEYKKDFTDDTFDIKTAVENLPLIEKTNIISAVVSDVVNYLTLSIY